MPSVRQANTPLSQIVLAEWQQMELEIEYSITKDGKKYTYGDEFNNCENYYKEIGEEINNYQLSDIAQEMYYDRINDTSFIDYNVYSGVYCGVWGHYEQINKIMRKFVRTIETPKFIKWKNI